MISFSAESALMSTSPETSGPSAIPATRNTATSGTRIFCANSPARVPTARMRPHDSSVCRAMSIAVELSKPGLDPLSRAGRASVQRLQPAGDFTHRHVGLLQQFAHGEKAVELAGKCPGGYGDAGVLQPRRIRIALVAQGISAGGQHIGRRQPG